MSKDSDIDLFALKEAVANILQDLNLRLYNILQDLNLRLYLLEADSEGYSGGFERCKNYIEELRDLNPMKKTMNEDEDELV